MSVGARLGRTVALALLGATLVSGGACSSRRHKAASPAVLLPPEDAYRSALEMIEARKLRKAKTTLENVQYTAESRGTIEPLVQLVLADLMFFGPGDVVSLIEARSKYLDFVTLYGEHPKAPYAQYQAGVCSLRQVAHATRDQTQTQTAISDFLEVTRRYPDSPYAIAARTSLDDAESNLAEHEFLVGQFYFKRKVYLAAADRFRGLLDKYPRYRGADKTYYYLGAALLRMNNPEEGRLYLDKLQDDFPNSRWTARARRLLAPPSAKP
jgi:outer membrane protein assembly factor BamD